MSLVWLALAHDAALLGQEYVVDEKVATPARQAPNAELAEGL